MVNIQINKKTESQIGQNAVIQRLVYEKATEIMGETLEVMDKEAERKNKKITF